MRLAGWLLVPLVGCARSPQAQPTSTSLGVSAGPVAPDAAVSFDASALFDASLPRPVPLPMEPRAADFCRGCVVARVASATGRLRGARILAESAYGRPPWRLGTGVTASFHLEVTTDAGVYVVQNVSGTEGVRETFSEVGSPETLEIRTVGGAPRIVATFVESYAGGGSTTRVPVLVLCAPAASGPPACLLVRAATLLPNGDIDDVGGKTRTTWTPVFP